MVWTASDLFLILNIYFDFRIFLLGTTVFRFRIFGRTIQDNRNLLHYTLERFYNKSE